MRIAFIVVFISMLNIHSAFCQLNFGIDTVYFRNEVVKKVSLGLDKNVWCIKGADQKGIGLVNQNGNASDLSIYLKTVTVSTFVGIQGFSSNDAFIATNNDFLYRLSASGSYTKITSISGITDGRINSIMYVNLDHSPGDVDIPLSGTTYDKQVNKKFILVGTKGGLFFSDDFIHFYIFDQYFYHINPIGYEVNYSERDFLNTSMYDPADSSVFDLSCNAKHDDIGGESIEFSIVGYDSTVYHNDKINSVAINFYNRTQFSGVYNSSFLYWGNKKGLKKRVYYEYFTDQGNEVKMLENQEVFNIKLAPARIYKDTIITNSNTTLNYDTTFHYANNLRITRYLFVGADSGLYYGKANFDYSIQQIELGGYKTQPDTMHRVTLAGANFTKVYDIGVDTTACGDLWLATDNGLLKVRTNFQKEIIYEAIQPQGRINICDRTINLNATLQNNSTVQWQRDNVDIPSATSLQYQTTVPGNYRYRINNNITTDCFSKPVTLVRDTSIVYSYPNINQSICKGDTFKLKVKTDTGFVYAWYRNNLFTGFTDSLIKPTIGGWYKAKVTNCYKMSSFSDSTLLTLSTVSKPTVFATKNPICTDDITQLYITPTGYNTLWQKNGIGDTTITNRTTITGLPNYSYKVTIKDTINCTETSNVISITSIAYPSLSLIPSNMGTLCKGSVLILQANTNTSQLLWSNNANTPNITIDQGGNYVVKTWFNPLCKTVDSVKIVEVDPPTFKLKSDTIFCFGELSPIELKAPLGFKTYQWNDNKTTSNTFTINQGGIVSLEIADANNCTVTSHITIEDRCKNLVVPNIFTPNGDGVNDVFEIKNLIPNTEISVFNRWGTLVYSTNNYDNKWNGSGLTDGLYYYSLYESFYKNEYKGWLEVAR